MHADAPAVDRMFRWLGIRKQLNSAAVFLLVLLYVWKVGVVFHKPLLPLSQTIKVSPGNMRESLPIRNLYSHATLDLTILSVNL